jgi:putative transposase
MQRVERHIVLKSNLNWKQIDTLAFATKNLYNKANYVVRQIFFESSKLVEIGEANHTEWIGYFKLDKLARQENWEEYKELPAQTAQQTLRLLEKNWKSFFNSIKDFKTNGCLGQPKLPNYKHKSKGRVVIIFTGQQVRLKDSYIYFPSKANLQPVKTNQTNIRQIRIIPQATCYVIEVVYEKEIQKDENLKDDLYLGIDLGLNNLVTATSNKIGLTPILINGRPLKSMNQYFNKMKALHQSYVGEKGTSNKILTLQHKRNNKIQNYLHHTSRFVIDYCQKHNIGNIVIGKNDGWKNKINIGKRNNQNFIQIPFQTLIEQIQYKAEEIGIKVISTEESYTSKASFLDKDFLPVYEKGQQYSFSGKRVKRGLYKAKSGQLINADVNGSLNILRKVIPNLFSDGIEGLMLIPVKISIKF